MNVHHWEFDLSGPDTIKIKMKKFVFIIIFLCIFLCIICIYYVCLYLSVFIYIYILINTQIIQNTCINTQIISSVKKRTHILFPLFNNTADYLLILAHWKYLWIAGKWTGQRVL